MATKDENLEELMDRKIGVLIEHMNDQFSKVLEAVDSSTSKIPQMSERIETLQHDVTSLKLQAFNLPQDLKLLKIRTEKLESISSQLDDHELRISGLEQTA